MKSTLVGGGAGWGSALDIRMINLPGQVLAPKSMNDDSTQMTESSLSYRTWALPASRFPSLFPNLSAHYSHLGNL